MLDKKFEPTKIESQLYEQWENSGCFASDPQSKKQSYTILMPPPNVTGSLHIGHALNHTLQDILIRYHRMQGYDTLWQPGTDHAGIATQMVVERQMDAEGISRHDLGREKFLERVWKWKEHSGGTIVSQLRRLGISPDWQRERFTMDEGLSEAVRQVFVKLYQEGLIYKDKRLVNWDCKLHTAISDLEVENVEAQGKMWRFRFPLADNPNEHVIIATTRPETMYGDTAIAVHPDDPRFSHLIGKHIMHPARNTEVPIIGDLHADPEKGTGALKVTPAHDFNDFEIGKRHNLSMISIFDINAKMNENTPQEVQGMTREQAREFVIAKLDALGLYDGADDHQMTIPYSERTNVIVEPMLTDQWFVDAETLAGPAIDAVRSGKTKFVPETWSKTYFQWLENIQPWCISRQLWWGHRIPAWYGPDGHVFVAHSQQEAESQALEHYKENLLLTQDEDVLDTWFSSALWPFSTLGWPQETPELAKYYPTSTLVTAHDIIFFWVARMMMMGIHFMKDIPFKEVYITALVRDEKGQKMSKSKGNVIDPLEFMDVYGADAVRFSLASLAGPGRSVNFSKNQVEGYRNFATKIWNATRFLDHNECKYDSSFDITTCKLALNHWVVGELSKAVIAVEECLKSYRFDEASLALYHFVWGTYCDWYIEFAKPILNGSDLEQKHEIQKASVWVLAKILHIVHPFMPFITEKLWQHLSNSDQLLMIQDWPNDVHDLFENESAAKEIDWLRDLVSEIRAARNDAGIPASAQLVLHGVQLEAETQVKILKHKMIILQMARLSDIDFAAIDVAASIQVIQGQDTYALAIGDVIDLADERKRLVASVAELNQEIASLDKKLSNADFVAKAPAEIIEKNNSRKEEAQQKLAKFEQALSRLGA